MEDPVSPPRQLSTAPVAVAYVMDVANAEQRGDYYDSYPTHERKSHVYCGVFVETGPPTQVILTQSLSLFQSQPLTNQATASPPNRPRVLERIVTPRHRRKEARAREAVAVHLRKEANQEAVVVLIVAPPRHRRNRPRAPRRRKKAAKIVTTTATGRFLVS